MLLVALCCAWLLAEAPWWMVLLWSPLFYLLALPVPAWQGSLDMQGRLWLRQQGQPATEVQLLAHSRVSWLGFWLCWSDSQGRHQQRWLFSDALPDEDKRMVARMIRQLRWQQQHPL